MEDQVKASVGRSLRVGVLQYECNIVNQVEVMVEVIAKEVHGNSTIIEENIGMRVSLPSPFSLDLWDSFITLIGNGQGSRVKVL